MKVLIAGGAGYIGSTIASMCADNAVTPVILDNLSTGSADFVRDRIFYMGDIADGATVQNIFDAHPDISVAILCAGVTDAPNSARQPQDYYRENLAKAIGFIESLIRAGCTRLIFSSSAAVYEATPDFGVDETSSVAPTTPYGSSKAMLEQILRDYCHSETLRAVSLRYQNVVGVDPHLRTGPPAIGSRRVLESVVDAALAQQPFTITGTDWPTRDGTAVRDYVHVWDLARAHLLTLQAFDALPSALSPEGFLALDLGTGIDTTVNELVQAAEAVVGRRIAVVRGPRRPGDVAGCYTHSQRAQQHLGWQPQLTVQDAVRDLLRWRQIGARIKHATASVFLFACQDSGWRIGLIHHPRLHRWMLPGGHVEAHENPAEAALREVREEAGMTAQLLSVHAGCLIDAAPGIPMPGWIAEQDVPADSRHHQAHVHVDHLYVAIATNREPAGQAELRFGWFGPEELAELGMFDETRRGAQWLFDRITQLVTMSNGPASPRTE